MELLPAEQAGGASLSCAAIPKTTRVQLMTGSDGDVRREDRRTRHGDLMTTARTYTHVVADRAELD